MLAGLLSGASPSAAKTVCGTLGDANDRFYGFVNATTFHTFSAPLAEGETGTGFATRIDGINDTVAGLTPTTTAWVDCKTVPKL